MFRAEQSSSASHRGYGHVLVDDKRHVSGSSTHLINKVFSGNEISSHEGKFRRNNHCVKLHHRTRTPYADDAPDHNDRQPHDYDHRHPDVFPDTNKC
ncbi:hypothetical protein PG994_007386 [Apiospora phragmitis]|uniref:Uncharacterized protein n=1 Tax=Apiospora phragmitis TaxID=2905665 RepID=A0ABR1V0S0_9PEZI